jgi:hypothetical protein
MAIYDNYSFILKLKLLKGLIQNLNRVNQNHSYYSGNFIIIGIIKYKISCVSCTQKDNSID